MSLVVILSIITVILCCVSQHSYKLVMLATCISVVIIIRSIIISLRDDVV